METRFKTKVLVVDIGGTNVKILATGQVERRRFPPGPTLRPTQMVFKVKKLARDWADKVVSIGYPGRVSAWTDIFGAVQPGQELGGFVGLKTIWAPED